MSRENVEVVRRGFDAFAARDAEALLALIDADVVWAPAIAPLLGVETMRGKEALRRFLFEDLFDGFDDFRAEPLAFEDLGDHVLVQSRYTGHGERSGLEIDQVFSAIYVVRDGKVVSMRDYETRAEALEAVGLRE
jgi:ketosteroid isomerase-like protein